MSYRSEISLIEFGRPRKTRKDKGRKRGKRRSRGKTRFKNARLAIQEKENVRATLNESVISGRKAATAGVAGAAVRGVLLRQRVGETARDAAIAGATGLASGTASELYVARKQAARNHRINKARKNVRRGKL